MIRLNYYSYNVYQFAGGRASESNLDSDPSGSSFYDRVIRKHAGGESCFGQ